MKALIPLATLALSIAPTHAATLIEVRAEALGPVGLAPFIIGFSDGSFDIFDAGAAASSALETLAETGAPSGFSPPSGGALLGPGVGPGSPPIFAPGASAIQTFNVADGHGMLNIASMVLPSNDWFIGNADALDVSSLLGATTGSSLTFTFGTVWDAGTELEDFDASAGNPLLPGLTNPGEGGPDVGTDQGGIVAPVTATDPFGAFANTTPTGLDTTVLDFNANGGADIARLTLTVVPEPGTGALAVAGLAAIGLRRHRDRQAARTATE